MTKNSVAIVVYGNINSARDALTEDKYKDLAEAFSSHGFSVKSVLFNDESRDQLLNELPEFNAILVWVNPIEQGKDRRNLDSLLIEISGKGCFVSTHPEVILKMGTKDVLYKTKDMDWGGDIKLYKSYEDFTNHYIAVLETSGVRVLKQYRGNGGNGVYKVSYSSSSKEIIITHAKAGSEKRILSLSKFYNEFKPFFLNDGMLIDQEWNEHTVNGMVRCYLSGAKVAGFGYQEINPFYELNDNPAQTHFEPSTRYYFTENCGLFADLREVMENKWVPELQKRLSIDAGMMPVIWDADFFINEVNVKNVKSKYSLCEINVSCVSPFPPSAIKYIVDEVSSRIENKSF
jgi:hypothetical protein